MTATSKAKDTPAKQQVAESTSQQNDESAAASDSVTPSKKIQQPAETADAAPAPGVTQNSPAGIDSDPIPQLPDITEAVALSPVSSGNESKSESRRSALGRRGLGNTVRLAEEKLDSLMAQAGELLVARQRIEIRPAEIEVTAALVAECRSEFQSIQRTLLTVIQQHGRDPQSKHSAGAGNRLEQIVEQTGEKRRRVEAELERFQHRLRVDSQQLNHTGESLQEDIHRIRMLPFADGCAGLD